MGWKSRFFCDFVKFWPLGWKSGFFCDFVGFWPLKKCSVCFLAPTLLDTVGFEVAPKGRPGGIRASDLQAPIPKSQNPKSPKSKIPKSKIPKIQNPKSKIPKIQNPQNPKIQNPKSKIPKIQNPSFFGRILGILDFWDFGDFGFWIVGILAFGILGILDFGDFGDFGFWGFWIFGILGILDFGFLEHYVADLYVQSLDFGIWGFWILGILDFGDLGFGILDWGFWMGTLWQNFGCYIRKEDCARRTGSADYQAYSLSLLFNFHKKPPSELLVANGSPLRITIKPTAYPCCSTSIRNRQVNLDDELDFVTIITSLSH